MQPLPHIYSVTGSAATAGKVILSTQGAPDLASAAPVQFDGPGDQWSPEALLTGALSSCFILTFRSVARASNLEWSRLAKAEHGCLIGNSLRCQRELQIEVVRRRELSCVG